MPNSAHKQGMTLPISTYNKLKKFREDNGFDSWDAAVKKLIEMDQKYNTIKKTVEYEFLTMGNSKVFRVTYGDGKPIVEYYNPKGWSRHISAWDNYPAISTKDKDLFVSFIIKSSSFIILQDMENQLHYDDFIIRKIS